MNGPEVMTLLAVTTMNLKYEDFRGHISPLDILPGKQVKRGPGWGVISLEFDLGSSLPYAVPKKGNA